MAHDPVRALDRFNEVRAALRASARGNVDRESPGNGCLDDDTIAALAEGSLSGSAAQRARAHAGDCDACGRAVGSVARALESAGVAGELERPRIMSKRRVVVLLTPLAAAAVLVVFFGPQRVNGPPPAHRAAPITAARAPAAVWPVGTVSSATGLRWTSVPGADRYRITVFDPGGAVLHATELADTTLVLPGSVALKADVTYSWRVEARVGFGRWAASELIEFKVAGAAPR